ncbi:MAG: diacylglycerol/lipid kinase family protein [Alkalispirochaeta sp.]
MSTAYRTAVECIARWTSDRLRRQFPHHSHVFICNPAAGTRHRHRTVRAVARRRCAGGHSTPDLWWTTSGEDARQRVADVLSRRNTPEPLIVSLGGDGTHNHILQAGIDHNGRGMFLRLPLGSGNDAAGVESLERALADVQGIMAPRWIPAVRISFPRGRQYAFNIASVGIDAYVTLLHNRWRTVLPGNTYRLLVDLAVLRYDRALHIKRLTLRGTSRDGTSRDLGATPRSLVVMGVSGHRTYGDHMHVLPGDDNVCIIEQAGLRDKMRMKRLFYEGSHVSQPITATYDLARLELFYTGTLPLQYDGEARYLTAEDFPLTLEVIDSAVRVLASDRV